MKFLATRSVNHLIKTLNALEEVEYAERIPLNKTTYTPNDLGANTLSGQWGLHKIRASDAWNISTGNPNIVVAVVDDAIQTTHPDLAANCLQGWDVANNDNNPNPTSTCHSHGTHVAGIVAADTDNNLGVAAIGFNIKILPVKSTLDTYPCGYISHAYDGVIWAAQNGADVINMSWGSSIYSNTNASIINYAWSQGAILVAAAGNSNTSSMSYPAAYPNVISVAATDINDKKASFSNYGNWVDIAAPGQTIKSTVPFNTYTSYDGTSMASPMVAGLCGLVWSVDINQSRQNVINCVLNTADNINAPNPSYNGLLGSGRINAYEALQCAISTTCPQNITLSNPLSGTLDFEVQDWIVGQANNVIQIGANVTYDAGNIIRLKDGFHAKKGSYFHAVIDGCGGSYKEGQEEEFVPNTEVHTVNKSSEIIVGQADNEPIINLFPNPFKEQINIQYSLSKAVEVNIQIYDGQGRLVLDQGEISKEKGKHQILFEASHLPTGIYYVTIQTARFKNTQKLIKL